MSGLLRFLNSNVKGVSTHCTATLRAESVLRILRSESSVAHEAVRAGVDVDTVTGWVSASIAAMHKAVSVKAAYRTEELMAA
jgi:hypothetical protein